MVAGPGVGGSAEEKGDSGFEGALCRGQPDEARAWVLRAGKQVIFHILP